MTSLKRLVGFHTDGRTRFASWRTYSKAIVSHKAEAMERQVSIAKLLRGCFRTNVSFDSMGRSLRQVHFLIVLIARAVWGGGGMFKSLTPCGKFDLPPLRPLPFFPVPPCQPRS
jgi:hypothetical protein